MLIFIITDNVCIQYVNFYKILLIQILLYCSYKLYMLMYMLHFTSYRYCIVQNIGSGKHWRIPLKTALVKKFWQLHPSKIMKHFWQKNVTNV